MTSETLIGSRGSASGQKEFLAFDGPKAHLRMAQTLRFRNLKGFLLVVYPPTRSLKLAS